MVRFFAGAAACFLMMTAAFLIWQGRAERRSDLPTAPPKLAIEAPTYVSMAMDITVNKPAAECGSGSASPAISASGCRSPPAAGSPRARIGISAPCARSGARSWWQDPAFLHLRPAGGLRGG